LECVDMAYIDGNHSYEATMRYYHWIKQKCNHNSIIVLDDIYWSDGMKKAWSEIKEDEAVTYTIDTFDLGYVFFDNIMPKQHFKITEFWKKPFRIGLWA
jgi:predicted O-methyltransferase YrrM